MINIIKTVYTRSKKGLTLVELAIVLVILASFSAAMIISAQEVSDTAAANAIISDLTTLRNAALAWYLDHIDEASAPGFDFGTVKKSDIIPYIKKGKADDKDDLVYRFDIGVRYDIWLIFYHVGKNSGNENYGIRSKLAARAGTMRLYKGGGWMSANPLIYGGEDPYNQHQVQDVDMSEVAIRVFE